MKLMQKKIISKHNAIEIGEDVRFKAMEKKYRP